VNFEKIIVDVQAAAPAPETRLAWPFEWCRSADRGHWDSARRMMRADFCAAANKGLIALFLRTTSATIAFSPPEVD
jgi:hypothetical protein